MCGRFTQRMSWRELHDLMDLVGAPPNLRPRYNVAPSQDVAVIRSDDKGRTLAMLRWGLIPAWAKDPAIGHRLINARSETAADKPSFRAAYRHRRCLIPADGFYEWRREGKTRQPWLFGLRGGAPFAFAGLWERWRVPEGAALTGIARRAQPRRRRRDLHHPHHRRQRDGGAGAWPHAGHPAARRLRFLARGRGRATRALSAGRHDRPSGEHAGQPAGQRRPALCRAHRPELSSGRPAG